MLGLLAERGPATPHELERLVGRSIGSFWPFPHTQLYAAPGRRRRLFSVTDRGREEPAGSTSRSTASSATATSAC